MSKKVCDRNKRHSYPKILFPKSKNLFLYIKVDKYLYTINKFHSYRSDISRIALPERFNFPFYYDPHPLSLLAAEELQLYLKNQSDFDHDFGLGDDDQGTGIGKMFGVLVVQDQHDALGYIAAYSGKLAGTNDHHFFVPTIFDMLDDMGFYKIEEAQISEINHTIERMEANPSYIEVKELLEEEKLRASSSIYEEKQMIKGEKKARKHRRAEAVGTLSAEAYAELQEGLKEDSMKEGFCLREIISYWDEKLLRAQAKVEQYSVQIDQLKKERKERSGALQQKLFDQYQFLNIRGERKGLVDIFTTERGIMPPSGAGECAAPKLLQYAFEHQLTPIALAEFWWGRESSYEIRKPGHFYPSCKTKCEPILGHMLVGMDVDENPMLKNPAIGKSLSYIYEDDHMAVISKPAEFLSVPGKTIQDSVAQRVKDKYPDATGPFIVHRLDMSTSGIMLIAKTKEVHRSLQNQFIRRKIDKQYVAILDGILEENEGVIELPLRVNYDHRPTQMVCYEQGKASTTKWKVVRRSDGQTRIHFYPITGRTHQLRVHAAHPRGLNLPIVGDDLYGRKGERLMLHAASITFWHPVKKELMTIKVDAPF